jgi:hypothetical protein
MHRDVDWPNAMEGTRIQGHTAVRAYWTRQLGEIDSHVEPQRFERDAGGRVVVDVHGVVRDTAGRPIADQ